MDTLKKRHDRLLGNLITMFKTVEGLLVSAATDACKKSRPYAEMIGANFNGHPWTKKMQVNVVIEDPKHAINLPVFGGMSDFTTGKKLRIW